MSKLNDIFNQSLQTGYVDKTIISDENFQPELLLNQRNPPQKVLLSLLKQLDNCEIFYFSVAFVTTSGVATIINKLQELEKRNIKGQILVSQYLNFSQPEALKRLLKFKNIDLRITTSGNSHSKGFIFKQNNHYNLIVGSSNLTAQALTTNKEWNLKISALDNSGIVEKLLNEFHSDFSKATLVDEKFILSYKEIYQKQFLLNKSNKLEISTENQEIIIPNSMQKEALENLTKLRADKKNKALLISATGTGKTFLSAFDAKAFNPKKLLFVVHRLTIAKKSLSTFQKVFGNKKSMGLYSGDKRDLESDFVFSTIQTISKFTHLENFSKDFFDYIIIDETHRSGADSYLRLLNYFTPKFLLGMTATPERTDGVDIFKLFDHNIAYEIRLNKAMEEEMLSSFHYYGVSDLIIDNKEIEKKSDFNLLISSERVDRIIEQANFYGSDNGITRGLIFCSKINEAIELSTLFNLKGFKTTALTGNNSEEERNKAIESLESDNLNEKLDYIFTVDIFNEGIDIPKINQIIMLRPTESAIIFIQQLGRGLRKIEGKSYLTIIDFIGNYENNYLIPIALYGDTSYNKDSLRRLLTEGSRMIPGSSTINFDEITKEKIFQSIDTANMQLLSDLKNDYNLLKYKLGRIPMMMDFIEHGSRDPFLYVEYANSYYNFIVRVEEDLNLKLSKEEVKLLELFSKEINNSKRVEECLIIKLIIEFSKISVSDLKENIFIKYKYLISNETIISCIANLNFEFIREKKDGKLISAKEIYDLDNLKMENEIISFSDKFKTYLNNETFKKYLIDSTEYSIYEFEKLFEINNWQNGFVLYRKYSRKDVFRILNITENPVAQNVGGYLVSPDNAHCPIFVNYHKEDHISESTKYEDKFVNNKEFDWMSKSNRKIESNDVQSILGKKGTIRLPLFIKKNNDEGMDFYYMGEVSPQLNNVEETTMSNDSGKNVSVVKIRFNLSNPVSTSMFNYLEEKSKAIKSENKENIITQKQENIDLNPIVKYQIPLYDFYAAAGSFGEMQYEKDFTLIELPENITYKSDYFACKIVGESMNRVIPNDSICLFRPDSGGSRNGKIVLVENIDIQDTDFKSSFTIKTYSSIKEITEDGWQHTSIILRPNSYESKYKDILINEENGVGMRVVGEFVAIIS
jgi:superfamily II DNA or RNA helicase/HKD family nuclease